MPNLGPTELIIILLIIIAIFGAGRLAGLGGALGRGVSDFRSAVNDRTEEPDEGKEASTVKPDAEPAKERSAGEEEGREEA